MAKVLVVDDEITMIQITSELLRADGHEVLSCSHLEAAVGLLDAHRPELVITDLYLERGKPTGMTLLSKAKAISPPPIVIVITGFATVETAVEARSEEHTSELQSRFGISYAVFC